MEELKIFDLPTYSTILPNGLQVITMPDQSGLVNVEICIGAGAYHEPVPGMAHLLEHLISTGEECINPPQFQKLVQEDSDFGANTGWMRTLYFCNNNLATDLKEVLQALIACVFFDAFSEKKLAREKQIVAREICERYTPEEQRERVILNQIMFLPKRFLLDIVGSPSTVAPIQLEDIRLFKETFYTATNAVVVITGTADHGQAVDLVEQLTTNLKKGTRIVSPYQQEICYGHHVFTEPLLTSRVTCFIGCIPPAVSEKETYSFIWLMNGLQDVNGRLHERLRTEKKLIYGLSFSDEELPILASAFSAGSSSEGLEEIKAVMLDEFSLVMENANSLADYLETKKHGLIKHILRQKMDGFAGQHANTIHNRWLAQDFIHPTTCSRSVVEEMTVVDLQTTAQKWLNPKKLAWGFIHSS